MTALLTLLYNPRDVFALQAAAAPGYPNKDRLLGRARAQELVRLLRAGESDPWAGVRRYQEGMREDDPDRRAVSHLLEAMDRLERAVADLEADVKDVVEAMAAVVDGAKPPAQRGRPDRFQDQDLVRLLRLADYVPHDPWETLVGPVRDLVDRWGMGQAGPLRDAGAVAIGPIEAARGQHWRAVFLLDVQDGKMPGPGAGDYEERLALEERLFYLAASRATEFLYFCMPQPQPGAGANAQVSRFLQPLVDGGHVEIKTLEAPGARGESG